MALALPTGQHGVPAYFAWTMLRPPVDNERYNRWVQASDSLTRLEAFMVPVLQGLGLLDCQLLAEDQRFLQLTPEARETIPESFRLTERFTFSYLWVLGAYELIRTLDQRCHADASLLNAELTQGVRRLKHRIERLRVPLAKMERARRYPSDSPIAYPAISSIHGVAWQLAANTFVSRQELSDALLQLTEDIREYVSHAA